MHGQDVHDSAVETYAIPVVDDVVDEVADEVDETNARVTDEVTTTYLIPTATTDTKVTTSAST